MDAQEMNKACELAFLVAREGVEQDPPIDPPASMRMFLYVRQFPQRALTVARQTMAEDPEFRARVAAEATVENTGADAVEWLRQSGVLTLDEVAAPETGEGIAGQSATQSAVSAEKDTTPVTKEAIRTELDELKSLVGQLADERAAVGDEVSDLETRLDQADRDLAIPQGIIDADDDTVPGSTPPASTPMSTGGGAMAAQVRSLHADLRQARSDRDAAQEAKEVAFLEQAELMDELDQLRALSASADARLDELEAKIETVSGQKTELENEKARLDAEAARLAEEAKSFSSERDDALAHSESMAAERTEAETKLASATADLERLTAEMDDVRSSAGSSVTDLRSAIAAQEALSSHVDTLSAAQAAARTEMERVNTALADRSTSDSEKISALQAALSSVVAERDALAAKLDLVRSSVTSVQGEMATLDATVSDAESTAGTLGDRVTDLSTSVAGIESEQVAPIDTAVLDTPDAPALVTPSMSVMGAAVPPMEPADLSDEVAGETGYEEVPASSEAMPDAAFEAIAGAPAVADDVTIESEAVAEESVEEAPVENIADGNMAAEISALVSATAEEELHGGYAVDSVEESVVEAHEVPAVAETDFTAGLLNDFPESSTEPAAEHARAEDIPSYEGASDEPPSEDIDEVHALVAETVATFDSGEEPEEAKRSRRGRGGLTSLFTSTAPPAAEPSVPEAEPSVPEVEAGVPEVGALEASVSEPDTSHDGVSEDLTPDALAEASTVGEDDPAEGGVDHDETESLEESGDAVAISRNPITIPEDIMSDPVAVARHVVRTEDAVLLIDGDPVAAMGWPSVERIDQRRNLVHFLSALAGSSGVAPDVLFDRDNGTDRLPDSRSVRVRITNEEGSVAAQVNRLIDTYPGEWPVVVVTDNMDLATEVAMKGATILDNGQLLDLFIAS